MQMGKRAFLSFSIVRRTEPKALHTELHPQPSLFIVRQALVKSLTAQDGFTLVILLPQPPRVLRL